MIVKKFTLDNVFMVSEIIDKMELEADVDKITKSIQTSKLENAKDAKSLGKEVAVGIGLDLITKMIRKLHKAKNEIKDLIIDMTGKPMEEIDKFDLKEMGDFFTELFNTDGFGDFLSQAGASEEKK